MEWIVIILVFLPLGVWVWGQSLQLNALTRRVAELERRLVEATGAAGAAPAAAAAAPIDAESQPAAAPAPAEEPEPLLLDTPVPEPSNDADAAAPAKPAPAREEPVLLLTDVVPEDEDEEGDAPVPFPPAAATPPPRVSRPRRFEQWLAENGLAWLGGVAAALAGIFAVSFAAQQNWFTPQVQLAGAVLLGLALIAASEWARRRALVKPPGHPLVAALLAGAGVVTYYAAAWAAHGPYGLVGAGTAATLLTLCAALLIGLSLLHGQALGVLAIGAALLAPTFASQNDWPGHAVTFYVGAVGVAGFGLAALRRWAWVGAATLAGLYFWFAAAVAADHVPRALALASLAAAGGVALAFRKPLAEEPAGRLSWTRLHAHGPGVAISLSSVLLLWTWIATASLPSGDVAGPAWVGAMFVALAASAVRTRFAPAAALMVAIGALVLGFVNYLSTRYGAPALGRDFYPFILFDALVVVISTVASRPERSARGRVAIAGAAGAALLAAVAASSRADWHHFSAWTPLFIGAAVLFAAAWFSASDAQDARSDTAVAAWIVGAAALLFLGVESAFPASVRTIAYGAAAVLLAAGLHWRGWRMLRHAALAAGVLAIGHALSPALIETALASEAALLGGLATLGAAAVLLFAAGTVASRVEPRGLTSEGLSAAGIIVVLTGLFLALRWIAAGGAGGALDAFSEASLRVLTLIATGHIVMPRAGVETGRINTWRGHALIGAGLLYLLVGTGTALNPWWGAEPARVAGAFPFDTLALAFAAPAALVFAAANRLYARQRTAARIYAGAGGVLAMLWAIMSLRRAFHGGDMSGDDVGLFEAACYGLLFLAAALAVASTARIRAAKNAERPFTHDLMLISRGCAWFGLVVAAYILLASRHPWWGIQDPTTSYAFSTLLAVAAQAVAVVLALLLGRALSRSPEVEPTRFAAASAAALFGWSFGHAAIRWFHHRGYMDNGPPMLELEGLAHAIWPLAFVVSAAFATARAPRPDTIRPYVYDLQAIWAAAIWPAMAFAALGLWLLFNPWWGAYPATLTTAVAAMLAFAILLGAAALSFTASGVPHVRWPEWFSRAAIVAIIGHLLVGATLAVRWLYQGAAMRAAPVADTEVWAYSALWALFGAGVFWLGMRRTDALQRWIGLILLVATWLYAVLQAFFRLDGLARSGSVLGLAAVLLVVAWLARTYRFGAPPGPGDLLPIKPSARRERRHGRRQRSS